MGIPLCTICNIFALCNEQWIDILSLDTARAMGFISTVMMTVSMICNHLMMQAQAKQMIGEGMRRASGMVDSVRRSILGTASNKVDVERTEMKQRFSVPEIDADLYDAVMIQQNDDHQEILENIAGQEIDAGNVDKKNDNDHDEPVSLEELMEIHEQMKRESLEI